ncbi:MAG: hypothetical protein ACI9BC_000186, partial [Crocinitomicaceae bacterium]
RLGYSECGRGILEVSQHRFVMNKVSGYVVSEYVTAVIIVVVIIAVGFGFYVGGERDTMVEAAEASLAALKERAEAAAEGGKLIACDNTLLDAGVLENAFLSLSIRPTLIDVTDPEAGYGAGIYVHSNKIADGNEIFDTTKRLHKALKENNKDALRSVKIIERDEKQGIEDQIKFSILASESAICASSDQMPGGMPAAELSMEDDQTSES